MVILFYFYFRRIWFVFNPLETKNKTVHPFCQKTHFTYMGFATTENFYIQCRWLMVASGSSRGPVIVWFEGIDATVRHIFGNDIDTVLLIPLIHLSGAIWSHIEGTVLRWNKFIRKEKYVWVLGPLLLYLLNWVQGIDKWLHPLFYLGFD